VSCEQLCRSLQRAQEKLDVEHREATTTWWEQGWGILGVFKVLIPEDRTLGLTGSPSPKKSWTP